MPTEGCSAIGGWLGELAGRYRLRSTDRRARENYRLLAPARPDDRAVDAAIRRLWNGVGRTMAEFSILDRLWGEGRIEVEGAARLAAAHAQGPVIVMGIHVANWEVVAPALHGLGHRFKFIYQPPRNRYQHRIAVQARRRAFGDALRQPSPSAALEVHRTLAAERGVVLMFADEYIRRRVNAPLFGRAPVRRSNLVFIARLALATGAVVVPAYAERTRHARFRVHFLAPLTLGPSDDPDAIMHGAARLNSVIEPLVRERLEQWFMLLDLRLDPNVGARQ